MYTAASIFALLALIGAVRNFGQFVQAISPFALLIFLAIVGFIYVGERNASFIATCEQALDSLDEEITF